MSAQVQADIPEGLCIVCLAKDSGVQAKLRGRRERYQRKLQGPVARISDFIDGGVEAIRSITRRFRTRRSGGAEDARNDFERQLAAHGTGLNALTPAVGVSEMLTFYRDTRMSGDPEMGDMLLCQWGTYDRGHGEHFECDITRQLVLPNGDASPDKDIWQLSLTFTFLGTESLRQLGSGTQWCASPAETDDFEAFVRGHATYAAVNDRSDGSVELNVEQVD